ncbi:MAG: hypothetical protein ABJM06_02525 [Gilvibacter sp.]
MNRLIIFSFLLFSFHTVVAQSNYEKGMQKALETWQAGKPQDAANIFERIATVETDNWLPSYYVALITTLESFQIKDQAQLTAQLAKARDFLNDAMALSKDNPELMVVEAQWYTSWIIFDGQKYGMQYSAKVAQLYEKALTIEPENPRAAFGKIEWEMGSARFFGKPMEPFCGRLVEALKLYDSYPEKETFYPKHGKGYGSQVIESTCNN